MRLITRSDFDGLACAVLLKEVGIVDSRLFVHPKDVQDGLIEVNENDVLANVPYAEGCGLWFDHHSSEEERLKLGNRRLNQSRINGRMEDLPGTKARETRREIRGTKVDLPGIKIRGIRRETRGIMAGIKAREISKLEG